MGRFDYAFQNYDSTRHVRSSLREKQISHKHAREIANKIKGMSIEKARDYLQAVIHKKRAVPFKRFKEQVGHRSDPGVMSGRYPEKSAAEFLKLLDNLESNAEYKGMDLVLNLKHSSLLQILLQLLETLHMLLLICLQILQQTKRLFQFF